MAFYLSKKNALLSELVIKGEKSVENIDLHIYVCIYIYICCYLVAKSNLATCKCPTLATPSTVARQAPLSMEFPRQEYRSGLPLPSPGDLPSPGMRPWQVDI